MKEFLDCSLKHFTSNYPSERINKLFETMQEFLEFRANCGALWSYNWVSIPMIYTQVN